MLTRANGFGIRNLSQVRSRHAFLTETPTAITGAPARCAAISAPGANERAGPRGPSGVIATSRPASSSRESPTRARLAPRDVEPRTVRNPNDSATRAISSPSRCSLMSTETPSSRC